MIAGRVIFTLSRTRGHITLTLCLIRAETSSSVGVLFSIEDLADPNAMQLAIRLQCNQQAKVRKAHLENNVDWQDVRAMAILVRINRDTI